LRRDFAGGRIVGARYEAAFAQAAKPSFLPASETSGSYFYPTDRFRFIAFVLEQ
jgi:hypothetical protein